MDPRHLLPSAWLGFLMLLGSLFPAEAGDTRELKSVPADAIPFAVTRHSVLSGIPLKVGDVAVERGELPAVPDLSAGEGSEEIRRCVERAPGWLEMSAEGRRLVVRPPFGSERHEVLTAHCGEEILLVGGRRHPTEEGGRILARRDALPAERPSDDRCRIRPDVLRRNLGERRADAPAGAVRRRHESRLSPGRPVASTRRILAETWPGGRHGHPGF